MRLFLIFSLFFIVLSSRAEEELKFDMDLEDLMKVRISNSASLIPTSIKKQPVSSTYITQDMIKDSGARNLSEVLEIYVPSYQSQLFSFTGGIDGFRGLVSKRKYLILVNGKVITSPRTSTNISEQDISLMGDIYSIEVIRGPGAAKLGPGAISGIISIKTFSPATFGNNSDVTIKKGFGEEFSSFEFRIGHQFNEKVNMFLYAGIDDYDGSDHNQSPYFSLKSYPGVGIQGDKAYSGADQANDSFEDGARYKVHLEFELGNFKTWMRYIRAGSQGNNLSSTINLLGGTEVHEAGTQQFNWVGEYLLEINKDTRAKFSTSYTMDDLALSLPSFTTDGDYLRSSRIDYYQTKGEVFWNPAKDHSFALGLEYTRYILGMESLLADESPSVSGYPDTKKWYSWAAALYGEYQYTISSDKILFLGGRLDEHSDTDVIFSPKIGLTYFVTELDTLKFLYNRSVRRPAESELRRLASDNTSPVNEKLDSFEVIYERQLTNNQTIDLSTYYFISDLENLNNSYASEEIGRLESAGFELSWNYKNEDWNVIASYSYTDLLNLKLEDKNNSNFFSPEPYGGSSDYINWATHQFKIYAKYKINNKLSVNSSLVANWGYDGAESAVHLNNSSSPGSDGGTAAFKESIYVNLGATYKLNDKTTIRAQAINILGWINDDYNKRNHNGMEIYRKEAEAFTLSLEYKF